MMNNGWLLLTMVIDEKILGIPSHVGGHHSGPIWIYLAASMLSREDGGYNTKNKVYKRYIYIYNQIGWYPTYPYVSYVLVLSMHIYIYDMM